MSTRIIEELLMSRSIVQPPPSFSILYITCWIRPNTPEHAGLQACRFIRRGMPQRFEPWILPARSEQKRSLFFSSAIIKYYYYISFITMLPSSLLSVRRQSISRSVSGAVQARPISTSTLASHPACSLHCSVRRGCRSMM